MIAREFGAGVSRNGGGVGKRFVVRVDDFRDGIVRVLRSDDGLVMLRAEVANCRVRVVQLVKAAFLKSDGERIRRFVLGTREQADDGTAVGAAAQETTSLRG